MGMATNPSERGDMEIDLDPNVLKVSDPSESNGSGKVHRIKRRAVEVTLSDGQKVLVFEPKTSDMGTFLRALPALTSISQAFRAAAEAQDGVMGLTVDIPDSVYEGLFPLIAVMTDMSVDDFKELPLFDGMALMNGLAVFAPNPQAVTPKTD
jgi:hypothetical protein